MLSRKKQNILTKGLTSELFLLAYIEPNNIRQLAQKLQNTSGNPTNYSKASPAIHDLTIGKYLKHNQDDEKYHVNISKLSDELINILNLKNIIFNEDEKTYLKKLLEENDFFKLISQDIIQKIQTQPKGKHDINALDVFCERIGGMAAMTLVQISMKKDSKFGTKELFEENMESIQEMKDVWSKMSEEMEREFSKLRKNMPENSVFEQFVFPLLRNMPSFLTIFFIPKEILEKLANLWSGYEGAKMALDVFSIFHEK